MLRTILLAILPSLAAAGPLLTQDPPTPSPPAQLAGPPDPADENPTDPRLRVWEDFAPAGAYLVGLETGHRRAPAGNLFYSYVKPFYSRGDGELIEGKPFGRPNKLQSVKKVLAKDGYAVGAIHCRYPSGTMLGGHRLIFHRIDPATGLKPDDSYSAPWVGDRGVNSVVDTKGQRTLASDSRSAAQSTPSPSSPPPAA